MKNKFILMGHRYKTPKTKEKVSSFIDFASKNFQIRHYLKGTILFEPQRHQIELTNFCEENDKVLVKKYRQGGFSTWAALWAFYNCIEKPNYKCMIVTKTDREACDNKYIADFAMDLMSNKPNFTKINDHRTDFANGSSLRCIGASGWRGQVADCIIFDECAFIPDFESVYKAFYPCVMGNPNGKILMISTPNGKQGYFYKTYKEALAWENNFKIYSPNYLESSFYNEKTTTELIAMHGPKGFCQEVLAEFLDVEIKNPTAN